MRSFRFAFSGIRLLLTHEHNAWIHLFLAGLSIVGGWFFSISSVEWALVIICIGMVLSAEAFNTAIEKMADFVHPEKNKNIGVIKDLAAGAVLIAAFCALTVAMIVFLPKMLSYF